MPLLQLRFEIAGELLNDERKQKSDSLLPLYLRCFNQQSQVDALWLASRTPQFEHLDHTADVQIHSWGNTIAEAFEFAAVGMFAVMTELDYVEIDDSVNVELTAKGHDMPSLLFAFLDEFLFSFRFLFIMMTSAT